MRNDHVVLVFSRGARCCCRIGGAGWLGGDPLVVLSMVALAATWYSLEVVMRCRERGNIGRRAAVSTLVVSLETLAARYAARTGMDAAASGLRFNKVVGGIQALPLRPALRRLIRVDCAPVTFSSGTTTTVTL